MEWLRSTVLRCSPDLALDFQGLLRSAVIGRASGASELVGLSDAREGAVWLYHRTVTAPAQPVHAVIRYLALSDAVSGDIRVGEEAVVGKELEYPLSAGSPVNLPAGFTEGFVLLHPYSRGNGKSLLSSVIRTFIRALSKSRIVLVGRDEHAVTDHDENLLNLFNRTSIQELIWLTRHASFVISVDSGPAHLAAALGRPMVAIHAWSDPRRVGPYRRDAWVWKNRRLIQVKDLPAMDSAFFEPGQLDLSEEDVAAIAALATSP